MSNYSFLGINVWTYSGNRAIAWIGRKSTHYSDKKHHLELESGGWGYLGFEVTVGGENREVMVRLGLGVLTLYVALTGVVPDVYRKAEEIAIANGTYAYQLDYSSQGRETGVMIGFNNGLWIATSLWNNFDEWTNRKMAEKFRRFPYCEGIGKTFYLVHPR